MAEVSSKWGPRAQARTQAPCVTENRAIWQSLMRISFWGDFNPTYSQPFSARPKTRCLLLLLHCQRSIMGNNRPYLHSFLTPIR
jgi:hypothetical protein